MDSSKRFEIDFPAVLIVTLFIGYLGTYIVANTLFGLIFCGIAIFVGLYGFFQLGFELNTRVFILIILIVITGVMNIFYIGNTSYFKLIYAVLCVGIVATLKDSIISRFAFLFSFYFYYAVIAYRMLTLGINYVFANSSENFVSVVLMMPLLLYYSTFSSKYEKAPIIPAVLFTIICVFAEGRTGILTALLLILGIIVYNFYYVGDQNVFNKLCIGVSLIVIILIGVTYFINNMDTLVNKYSFLDHFQRSGLTSESRVIIWKEYLSEATKNFKSFLFGVNYRQNPLLLSKDGNPHNSFFNIHQYNGILMLFFVVVMIVKTIIIELREENYIFIFCFFLLLLRGFMDNVFWNNYGTVFLFWFMINPFIPNLYQEEEKIA